MSIHHFCKHNLDALFVVTNAPGRSAFNRVERRMAPLSRELAGLILPHEKFGSHLDSQGRTIDRDLEKKKFRHAGECLAEVWSDLHIDGFPVVANYIDPESSEVSTENIIKKNSDWFARHVQTSQYLLQIVKCSDRDCCSETRSSYFKFIQNRFLPAPIPMKNDLIVPTSSENYKDCKYLPLFKRLAIDPTGIPFHNKLKYDTYCPSILNIENRICGGCGQYFASQSMLMEHKKIHSEVLQHVKKIRPVRVAAKRQREVMAIIANQENILDLEWIQEDLLDLRGVNIPDENLEHNCSILTVEQRFAQSEFE